MSETFITIDSLQRQTYPTNRSKICFATFTVSSRFGDIQESAKSPNSE